MYAKLHCFIHFVLALAIFLAALVVGHSETPAPSATGTLHGRIADPTGALLPGARITVATTAGAQAAAATSDASGAYTVRNLAPGTYVVKVTVDGFAPFVSQPIQLAAGQVKRVDISMAIATEQQSVVVTDESPTVSVEAGANADAVVLKGKDLDALSDDPDELENELMALAGPSAGPNGGQIYIDGFSGGELPPKSAIREIRINQNPFSAEYDRLGYGRIEILTKPGTNKLHGRFFLMGNDKSFNTGNPFTNTIPSYYSYQFNGTVEDSLTKNSSFFLSGEERNIENVNAWRIFNAVLDQGTGSTPFVNVPDYGVNLLNRRIRNNVSARVDWQLGKSNTLTTRYGFWSESEHGDLNSGSLPSASTHESNTDHTVQMSDSIILNDHAVNETRFQFQRHNENYYPDSTDRTINVQGDFTGGGYPGQMYRDHTTNLELWNITTLSHGGHSIEFGTRMRDARDANLTTSNFNGAFTFANYDQYLNMANGLAAGTPFDQLVSEGYGPASASYTTAYTSGQDSSLANVFDVALFAQDDWRVNPRLTLSGGLRWEAQNHVSDHNDWAPRASLAYALDGGKDRKKTKTVLRAGYGLFYDRFGSGDLLTIERSNVLKQTVLNDPTCTGSATALDEIDMSTCSSTGGSSTTSTPVKYEVDPTYHSPDTGQFGVSIERQLLPGTSVTTTYLRSFGVHQMVTRNANQATGGTPQTNTGGYLYEYYPEGVFKENQMIVSVNGQLTKKLRLMGSYTLASANSNGAGGSDASNAYDLDQDYGRAGFVSRNMLFMMGAYDGPWGIRFNPFLIAFAGRPFNITLPTDPLNNFFNQRPAYATSSDCASSTGRYVQTSFGCFDTQPASGEQLAPINLGNSPASVAFNLRISRSIGLGPKLEPNAGPAGGSHGGGGYHGRGLGPGGLGGGGGGLRGMFGGGSTGRKYSLEFTAQALNLFNNIDYGTPTGTLTPTVDPVTGAVTPGSQFGKSSNLAGGIFSSGSAARRIYVQAVFSF